MMMANDATGERLFACFASPGADWVNSVPAPLGGGGAAGGCWAWHRASGFAAPLPLGAAGASHC